MRKLAVISAILYLFVVLFGMHFSMMSNKDGRMTDCPVMNNHSSFCQMGVVEHIAKWQQVFQALPFTNTFLLFVIGLSLIVLLFYVRTHFSYAHPVVNRLIYYQKEYPDSKVFDNLLLAFSDGILHPKIYE